VKKEIFKLPKGEAKFYLLKDIYDDLPDFYPVSPQDFHNYFLA
jgi:hypothetical protein